MKKCTWCGREYPETAVVCSVDQQPLASVQPPTKTEAVAEDPSAKTWPAQVLLPAVIWLVANFLLTGFFSLAGCLLFGWVSAIWAAIDCSKLQNRDTRTLGIAFKPVVVFAVCAFFLCGLGFIWYLVIRHRVKNTPPESEPQTPDWFPKPGKD